VHDRQFLKQRLKLRAVFCFSFVAQVTLLHLFICRPLCRKKNAAMQKILFILFLTQMACTQPAPAQSLLDAAQTEAMLKTDKQVQLVDLRTPGEIKQTGKIEGALEINFTGPDFQTRIAKLDKEKAVIVYCAAGGRSPRAAAQMQEMGFKKVFDYAGGMNDWKAKGKKTVQ